MGLTAEEVKVILALGGDDFPLPTLSDEAYYGVIGDYVRAVEAYTEAHPAGILTAVLAGVGNAMGRGPLWIAGADHHYPVLNVAHVGPTSDGRKSSIHGVALGGLRQADSEWRSSGLPQTAQGLIWAVRDPIYKLDKNGEEVLDDPGVSDKRILLRTPELARVFNAKKADGSQLADQLRELFDCEYVVRPLVSGRDKSKPTYTATGAHVSLMGGITQGELEHLLEDVDVVNGFVNRFLWVCVKDVRDLPDSKIPPELFKQWGDTFYERLLSVHSGEYVFDPEAGAIWDKLYPRLKRPDHSRPAAARAATARSYMLIRRMALIHAAINGSPGIIGPAHLGAALAMWQYCDESVEHIFPDPWERRILDHLHGDPDRAHKQQDIGDAVCGNKRGRRELHEALHLLLGRGRVECKKGETTGRGGRPSILWRLARPRGVLS